MGALRRPKGILLYAYVPNRHVKVVFYLSHSLLVDLAWLPDPRPLGLAWPLDRTKPKALGCSMTVKPKSIGSRLAARPNCLGFDMPAKPKKLGSRLVAGPNCLEFGMPVRSKSGLATRPKRLGSRLAAKPNSLGSSLASRPKAIEKHYLEYFNGSLNVYLLTKQL